MTRALLAPLGLVYALALRVKNRHYDSVEPRYLRQPVISVGNLSVGGSGKTPLVIHLAQILQQQGWNVDVISRGYGRSGHGVERVEESGSAERFGDEPLLIARTAHVPVYVGANRFEAGLQAERELPGTPNSVHLLDDGFQHRQLGRTVDIVLVHRSDFTDRLLPLGRLREPLPALKRADIIVLRAEDAELAAMLQPHLRNGVLVWRLKRKLSIPGCEKKVLAFCAIARPGEFFQALRGASLEVAATRSFRDHHPYTENDIESLGQLLRRYQCEAFVTTEKDAVKLHTKLMRKIVQSAPVRVASLSLEIEQESTAVQQLLASLEPLESDRR